MNLNGPEAFDHRWMEDVPWFAMTKEQGYHLFALHTKWNHTEVEKVLGEGAIYITIIRDPVDQFESSYSYFHFGNNNHSNLDEFSSWIVNEKLRTGNWPDYFERHDISERHIQLGDLGLFKEDLKSTDIIMEKIKQIENQFDLVMIAEQFDESLVLLANLLCWNLTQVTSLKVNARKKDLVSPVKATTRKILKQWLCADYLLYNHFLEVFETKKENFGKQELTRRTLRLQQLNKDIEERCIISSSEDPGVDLDLQYKPWVTDVVGYNINETEKSCSLYGTPEIKMIEYIRRKQIDRAKHFQTKSLPRLNLFKNHTD